MADRLITQEAAAAYVAEHCPNKIDVTTWGQPPGSEHMCGCGHCPTPDPTPEQLQAGIDYMIWHDLGSVE